MDVVTEMGVPEWFDLSWYDQLNTFTPIEWATALQMRYHINTLLSKPRSRRGAESLFETKISEPCTKKEPLLQNLADCYYPSETFHTPTVSLLSTDTYTALYYLMTEFGYDGTTPFSWEIVEAGDLPERLYVNDVLGEELGSSIHMEVSLDGSDKEILNSLKAMLPKIRERYNINNQKHVTNAVMEKWCASKALAYIDLKLWQQLNGTHLTDNKLGLALFPGEHNIVPSERVRRTTKEHANKMLQRNTLAALFSQTPN